MRRNLNIDLSITTPSREMNSMAKVYFRKVSSDQGSGLQTQPIEKKHPGNEGVFYEPTAEDIRGDRQKILDR